MNRAELGGPLLKAVSRSFYLTIRVLPRGLHEVIGLAYLLARASDTIADSAAAPAAVRLEHLAAFGRMISAGGRAGLDRLQSEIEPAGEGERVLIAQTGACLDWLESLPEVDRAEIRSLLEKIIRGQSLDLQRFGTPADGSVVALQTAAELDEYTYLVAGCVGEFWTRVCLRHLPDYSRIAADELCQIGIRFGQGLQLVNILRDLPEDLRHGRCYLPADGLAKVGVSPGAVRVNPMSAFPVFSVWLARARTHLQSGAQYIRAIRPARVRLACYLPWFLGVRTLDLLEARNPLESSAKMKVSRETVYCAFALGLAAMFTDLPVSRTKIGSPAV